MSLIIKKNKYGPKSFYHLVYDFTFCLKAKVVKLNSRGGTVFKSV